LDNAADMNHRNPKHPFQTQIFHHYQSHHNIAMEENSFGHQHHQQHSSVISDSMAKFANGRAHNKRPLSNNSHHNYDERDTTMTGDDSSSSYDSISEMRSLKRLRIEDSPISLPQYPIPQTRELQHPVPVFYHQPPTSTSDGVACQNPIDSRVSSSSAGKYSHSISRWSQPDDGDEAGGGKIFNGIKNQEIVHSRTSPIAKNEILLESTSLQHSNRLLGNLHFERRRRRIDVNTVVGKRDHHNPSQEQVTEQQEAKVKLDPSSQQVLQQYRHRQPQKENVPKWKRQICLQSNSQLF